jgi:hypothetical protein
VVDFPARRPVVRLQVSGRTKGAPSLEENFQFNLFKFCSILDGLFPTLEGAAIGAYEEYQNKLP